MARHRFKPGHAGVQRCEAITQTGKRCGFVAVKGLKVGGEHRCKLHGRLALGRLRKRGRPRCEAWIFNKPRRQCKQPAKHGGLCEVHARLERNGRNVQRTPDTVRVERMPLPAGTCGGPSAIARMGRRTGSTGQSARTYERALAAPRELTSTPAWRMARGSERAALVHAWEGRETSPGAWLALVRQIAARGEE